ncbi:ATP-binding protein [Streptomyces sp. NPDC088785]|uniref:ATP-binding protein n=1 Tax=Streptomyces sp. NPDC088785 TaxID=3365897 RepID=UPI003826C3A4
MRAEHDGAHGSSRARPALAAAPLTLSGAEARELVRRATLACLAADAAQTLATERLLAEAQLVCSELVSNAHRHGGGLYWFEARAHDGQVLIDVGDRSTQQPRSPRRDATEPGGFGWDLVQRLATQVVVTIHPDGAGKTIRAVIRVR